MTSTASAASMPSRRTLAVNAAVFTTAGIGMLAIATVLDDASPPAVMRACAAIALATGVGLAAVPMTRARQPATGTAVVALFIVLSLSPLLVPPATGLLRFVVCLHAGLLGLKLVDLHVEAGRGVPRETAAGSLFLLGMPLVLRRLAFAVNDRAIEWRRFRRRAAGTIAAAALLGTAMLVPWVPGSFYLEHTVKMTALILLATYAVNLLMSATRLLGGSSIDFADHPVAAHSPSDFWRRYNRWVQQWLYEDLFRVVGGRRSPVVGTLLVFLFSGVLHEYAFDVASGEFHGYQLAFFGIHGLAVALTLRFRPAGAARLLAVAGTFLFNAVTSMLFLVNVHRIVPVYASEVPAWLVW